MSIPSAEEIDARLKALEARIRALRTAYEEAENEKKRLLLAWQTQWERTRARLLLLHQKVSRALSHGTGDSDMDTIGAAADGTGTPRNDNSAGEPTGDPSGGSQ